ncbi:ATP phosphoribosyltransferase [Caldalkalibacillus thermarum]|uniref:ATP phosphoribosyltransferase n=1 Tax=Caldalkalibacillus thermarum TaxID=296745 RepID=UPI001662F5CB|nr:ATP phosphoribosyltransferase [Caldalkalibacillus thermarum]GGK34848.1 ATP phosphoribosyltransferase [Caldalkalibacillus thermarum]
MIDERKPRAKPILAIPKGRLLKEVAILFEESGIIHREELLQTRKLMFKLPEVDLVLLKSQDIVRLLTLGQVDAGIVGKDIIEESQLPVKELLDLNIGKCKLCLCGKNSLNDDTINVVCTSYPYITKKYLKSKGYNANIVTLDGSVEVAPLMEYADCIVELVDTGRTLMENGLSLYKEIMQVSARFIISSESDKELAGIKNIYDKLNQSISVVR